MNFQKADKTNIFTDFKRFNETSFWSESRQVWLDQFDLQSDKYFNQDFLFFDEVRYHNDNLVIIHYSAFQNYRERTLRTVSKDYELNK